MRSFKHACKAGLEWATIVLITSSRSTWSDRGLSCGWSWCIIVWMTVIVTWLENTYKLTFVTAGHHCFYFTIIYNINQSVRYLDLMLHWWWRRRRVTTLIPASWMICDWWRGWRLSRWPHWRWSRRPLNWWCRSRPCPTSCCPWALLKWTIIRLLCWTTADWRNRCTLMIWSIATQLWLKIEKNRNC